MSTERVFCSESFTLVRLDLHCFVYSQNSTTTEMTAQLFSIFATIFFNSFVGSLPAHAQLRTQPVTSRECVRRFLDSLL